MWVNTFLGKLHFTFFSSPTYELQFEFYSEQKCDWNEHSTEQIDSIYQHVDCDYNRVMNVSKYYAGKFKVSFFHLHFPLKIDAIYSHFSAVVSTFNAAVDDELCRASDPENSS